MRRGLRREVPAACALLLVLLGKADLRAEWPFVWDFAGSSDVPMAAQLGVGGDLWVLSESNVPGQGTPRAVLLRIATDGSLLWATDDPGLMRPTALALSPDGSALAIGRSDAGLQVTAFTPEGAIAWTRSRTGAAPDLPFSGPHAAPIWDELASPSGPSGAWRIPTGLGGDFAVLSFAADGEALPDRIWSPPSGTGRVTSVLPRAGGGLLLSGIVEDTPPPGWWTVALDAAGAEVWKHFEFGDSPAGAFSGAFLLSGGPSGEPVRLWAVDETKCGRFSLRLWSLDAATGAPLWDATWPTTGFPECDSFTPTSVALAGGRILVSGTGDVASVAAHFDPIALSFDATSGETAWERTYIGATTGIRADVASADGSALVASSLFPDPDGPTPLWLSTWDRAGAACVAPFEVLSARLIGAFLTSSGRWLLVGGAYNFAGNTTDDLVVQRTQNPCSALFADSFESGGTGGWSSTSP